MSNATPLSGPAGSRRFWVTVICFAVANLGLWVGYDRFVQHRHHTLLEVRQSAPAANSQVSGRPTFWWTFNLDVAPVKPSDPPPGTMSPAVAGKWVWDNSRTLTFTPDAPLPKATAFNVTLLPERLQTPDGFRLKEPHVISVHTQPLEVLGVRQAMFDAQDRLVLEIEFNDEIVPSEVLAHLSLLSWEGKPVGFQPHGEALGRTVRVMTEPLPAASSDPSKSYVKLKLAPGVNGRSGPLGLASAYECNLPIDSGLVATEARAYAEGRDDTMLAVRFNNPVSLNILKPLLSVEPAVPFTLSSSYRGTELHGAFQPATRYAIKIAKAPVGVPRADCPRPDTLSVYVPDRAPALWFEHDEGYLGSAGNRTLMAHAVNVSNLRVALTRCYDNNLITWRNNRNDIDGYYKPVTTRNLRLASLKNKTQDVRLSLDELLPASAPRDGVYLVSLQSISATQANSGAEDRDEGGYPSATSMITLSDIGLSAKAGRSAITVWATSLRTAEPLAHVRVRLYSNKNQLVGEATTADDGLASIAPTPAPTGEEPALVIADRPSAPVDAPLVDRSLADATSAAQSASVGRDLTWLDLRTSRINFGEADTTGAAWLRDGHEAFIYSDRGVYRPGETVHLRAIVRDPDGKVPPGFPVRWQFRRPDLHDWKSYPGQIDSDGAVSLDLPLPADLPTGQWSVMLGLPGSEKQAGSFGTAAFGVEDFMPNRMQVALDLKGSKVAVPAESQVDSKAAAGLANATPRFFVGDDPVGAQVQADYLFGKPVTERPARLVARLDPSTFAPPKWEGWTFGDSASTADTLEGLKVTGHRAELPEQTLDAHGHAGFDLDLETLLSGSETTASGKRSVPGGQGSRSTQFTKIGRAARVGHRRGSADFGELSRTGASPSLPEHPLKTAAHYTGPWRLTVTASVIEAGGRAVSASRQAELDPVGSYIGIRARSSAAAIAGQTSFDIALVSTDGQTAAGNAELQAALYRETWNNSLVFESGRYVYHSTRLLEPIGKEQSVRLTNGKGTCDLQPPDFGQYVLRVLDPASGCMTSLTFYSGRGAWEDNISRENPEKLELLVRPLPQTGALARAIRALDGPGAIAAARAMFAAPTKENGKFQVGDFAQVIVRSPFAGRLLLSVETDDVISTRIVEMPASHIAVPVRITGACRPNSFITASVVRPIHPDASWRTHRAIGTVRVPIDNSDRKLVVEMESRPEIRPSTSLSFPLRITDSSGAPVENAAVTVAAVDEGICQLTGFKTPDPFGFFMRNRALGVETADLYSQLMPEVPRLDKISAVGGDKDAYDPRHGSPVSARRVKPVSLVTAVLHTNANGLARADFSVPQFTGKLRLMAVASAEQSFGSGQGATLVRSPLLVQSSWPRFAAPGDKFLVPLVVFNNSPDQGDATIALHIADGPLRFGNSRDLSLPGVRMVANAQVIRTIEVTVGEDSGVSHVQLAATMGDERYEEDVELPVRPASPEIQLGGYAVATPDKPAQISLPGGMLGSTAHMEIKITPWPTLQLPQGLDSLERYPYGCLEQTTSTLFPLVYLNDVGQQIAPGLFEKQRVDDKVQVGITRLIGMQTANGGLSMWPAYREPWPWGSVYAAHFLIEAQNAGHPVPGEFRGQLLSYVRSLLNESSDNPDVLETQAYACYVLALAGKPERAVMSRLSEVVNTPRPDGVIIPGQARFHLAAAWLASGRRDLAENLIPQTLPAPREKRSLAGSLGSPVRDRAILVDTLLAVQPENPALPDLVQQLADSGRHGQWRSTQDTAFAMLALGHYLRQNKTTAPYDAAELRLDGKHVGDVTEGKPLSWEAGDKSGPLPQDGAKVAVSITGPSGARAHLSWLQVGVPLKTPPAADHGMKIRRRLLDEHGKPLKANRIQSGDLVQVELSISADTPLEYIAIDDLLPAGLEIENPRLATTAVDVVTPAEAQRKVNMFQDARLDMRDDRLVLIGNLSGAGTGTYMYTARAVTPGIFVLPPAHAECMYDSAINSLSGGGTFEVISAGPSRIASVRDGD